MSGKEQNCISSAKKEYIRILLQQYSEVWESIRNDSNSVWQIPTLLITTISVLSIAYTQVYQIQNAQSQQIARILILLVGFGFVLVSLMALLKHRLSCNRRTEDFENIQAQIERLLQQKEFTSFFQETKKEANSEDVEIRLLKIVFRSKDFVKEHRWLFLRSAYKWQRNLVLSLLIGITSLLEYEFWLLGQFYLIVLGIIPFLAFGFWLLVEKETDEKDNTKKDGHP